VTARHVAQDAPRKPTSTQRGGIGQPVEPPDLRGPGATHVDYPTVLVAHGDAEVRSTLVDCLQRNGFHVLECKRLGACVLLGQSAFKTDPSRVGGGEQGRIDAAAKTVRLRSEGRVRHRTSRCR
jgi:hypothetical protein